ncbi:acylneuraminate cytidylyltransferase family protein [Terasakiella sp. A23]|uniref:acylneuraminate cytidylyltransferase family protein n=1 Tax=Terasakiella sp. FCG-A23 TaxID=3080561 RepID=UPI00295436D9|nr:acylneuraminate cytidylyltransferase family protein [Terasakiella sp. A23]MDV7340806.1 acylneuraminate cytidylyltransferase family protein [Terasakiella sp. A23]
MIDNKPVIAIVLARGGSKRLPGKNIKQFGDKPLIVWTLQAAQNAKTIDRVILSSDDQDIMDTFRKAGGEVPFRRPDALASDDASSADAVLHALEELNIETGYLVLLQPTSPLRNAQDIDNCVTMCVEKAAPLCESVTALGFPASWLFSQNPDGYLQKIGLADDKPLLRPNGAVYVADVAWFKKHQAFWSEGQTAAYEIPFARSIDIDTESDFQIAQAFLHSHLFNECV